VLHRPLETTAAMRGRREFDPASPCAHVCAAPSRSSL